MRRSVALLRLFGQHGVDHCDKLGRQIVNWGRSDTVRVLDVINPLDNREPGLVDIEDLRLPVTMARVDYFPKWFWTRTFFPSRWSRISPLRAMMPWRPRAMSVLRIFSYAGVP